MRKTDFLYWLQGFLELRGNNKSFTRDQTRSIYQHLALVKTREPLNGLLAWLDNALVIVEKSGKPHLIDPVALQKNIQREFINVTNPQVTSKNINKEYCGEGKDYSWFDKDYAAWVKRTEKHLTEGNRGAKTNDENPFLDQYEPLPEIYKTQRLC